MGTCGSERCGVVVQSNISSLRRNIWESLRRYVVAGVADAPCVVSSSAASRRACRASDEFSRVARFGAEVVKCHRAEGAIVVQFDAAKAKMDATAAELKAAESGLVCVRRCVPCQRRPR
jgi:hypothetical protein